MSIFQKLGIFTGLAGLALMMSACAQILPKEYYIGFLNKTGHRLDGVGLYYGDKETAAKGVLVSGGRATYGSLTIAIPSEAEVRWVENGEQHATKAKLD